MACVYAHIYCVYYECMDFMVKCILAALNRRFSRLPPPSPGASTDAERLTLGCRPENGDRLEMPRSGTLHSFLCGFVLNMQKDNLLE